MEVTLGLGIAFAFLVLGAAVAVGLAAFGSALGQGMAAAAGVGAVAEKDYNFGKVLAVVAMPETQAIYGFVIAIIILFVVVGSLTGIIGM
jgi:V/A-type H+-transporting ATPase subunit K